MSANDKKRKGSAKKHNALKYSSGNRLMLNRIRREAKNLAENPRDIDGLNRCQEILRGYIGPLRARLLAAVEESKKSLSLEG